MSGTKWPSSEVTLVTTRFVVPVLDTVRGKASEGAVMSTSPKARGDGATPMIGLIPVPLIG